MDPSTKVEGLPPKLRRLPARYTAVLHAIFIEYSQLTTDYFCRPRLRTRTC